MAQWQGISFFLLILPTLINTHFYANNNTHMTMKRFTLPAIAVAMMIAAAPAAAQNVQQLENEIEQHEKSIKDKEAAIADLEQRIGDLESQVKDLKNQKKDLEKSLKEEVKMRKDKFTVRDGLVFDEEISDVLFNPYNKSDVEEALRSFDGMETKEVIKKKELVERYGEYTKDLKKFLEEQKNVLAKGNWAYQSSTSETYKKFDKALKGTKYWKVYNNKEKKESIDYLDRVVDRVMLLKNKGLNNEAEYNEIINMLYAN